MKNIRNKYKVEFTRTETIVVDVWADNEVKAEKRAMRDFEIITEEGVLQYYQIGDAKTELGNIYDVTDTDDPFDEGEDKKSEEK